jgi:hypothetical protein
MWRPPVEKEAPRLRNVDVVVAQQFELIEHQQQTGGIAAGIDAIELMHVIHIFGASARHMVFCAGYPADAPIEPGACHSTAFRSAAADEWPAAKSCASFARSSAMRSNSARYLQPKP